MDSILDFKYTNEGLLVYDINSNTKIDKYRRESNGITVQDYKVFCHTIPIVRYDKDAKFDYYQKFKSYTNALAPFAGLELASEHGIFVKIILFREENIRVPSAIQKHKGP